MAQHFFITHTTNVGTLGLSVRTSKASQNRHAVSAPDPNGVARSSNRSVIPELAEGSPADKRSHPSPPTDPNGVAQSSNRR